MEFFKKHGSWMLILVLCAVLLSGCGGLTPGGSAVLAADCVLESTGVDMETHSLLADVTMTLKDRVTKPALLLKVGETSADFPLSETAEDSVFTGSVEVPLEPVRRFQLYLTTEKDETVVIGEQLGRWDHVAMLLPLRMTESQYSVPTYQDGGLGIRRGLGAKLKDRDGNAVHTADAPEFRSYRNGELVWAVPGKLNENVIGRDEPDSYIPETKENWDVPCEVGDEVLLTFACKDETGLGYEFVIVRFQMTGKGVETLRPEEDADPILTWPE